MNSLGTSTEEEKNAIQKQAGKLLSQVAGYVGTKTMGIGMRYGLYEEIANHPEGISAGELAKLKDLDPFYTEVWCKSAYSSEQLELKKDHNYILAPYLDKLLLDKDFPGYIGGMPKVINSPEMFDIFTERLPSGERAWWDEFSPEWIQSVSLAGLPFYTRLISEGLPKVPGLSEKLTTGAHVLELACGAGNGLVKIAQTYPQSSFVGLDGDAYSLEQVTAKINRKGLQDRVSVENSMLEDINESNKYDMVFINISMHECRNIDDVTKNVHRALKPGGYFVVSEFPFPNSLEESRSVPARIMGGIQFFEAIIDDQLLPTQAFIDLLNKHEFRNVGAFDLAPVHSVIYGQK
jgi:ubiquinone/menaquinone biosynthesis C-methylase UbiE